LRKYFAHGFIPAPNAALAGARKLEPGRWLSFDLDEERLQSGSYWRFELEPARPGGAADEAGLAEELLRLLRQAVRRRMMSDVPLGVFLSGGVDSSAVLALAAEGGAPGSVSTFTIGFGDPSYDESGPARIMAAAAKSAHFERRLDLDDAQVLAARVLERLDEPIADASIVPTYLLSGFAHERVKVALGGDGGDELFAGYDPVAALGLARIYDRVVPRLLRRPLRRLVGLLPIGTANMSLDFKLRRALAGLDWPAEMWNPAWLAPLQPGEVAELFQQPADAEEIYSEAIALWRRDPKLTPLERTLEFQTRYYLADGVLAKVDRASMMHGLEARAPFLDTDLVEFVRRLPTAMKYRKGERKVLLKRALAGLVPDALLRRPKKGFGVPLVQWMRESPPETGSVRGVALDRDWIESQRTAHANGRADQRLFLWSWLAVQRSWINDAGVARAPGQRIVEAATPAPRRRRTSARAFR
jgi:asparagine synthase (glutamine-hydrolysing)